MGFRLVAVVTVLYTLAAVSEALNERPSHAIIFLGYVLANVGLLWSMS